MLTYSIIIPHRDIPQLLQRCLESIPQHPDLEIIVVDDNSDPKVVDFACFPGQERSDTTIILDKTGLGAGHARNIGLEHAKGKWLLFTDADDIYVDDMYDILNHKKESDADVIFFKMRSVMSNDLNKPIKRMTYINTYIDDYLMTGDERNIRLRHPVPWGKMIKRDFVSRNHFHFDETQYTNDNFFAVCVGYYAKKIEAVDIVLYIYTMRRDSLSGVFCSKPGELAVRTEVSFRIQKMFKEQKIDIDQQRPLKWYLMELLKKDRALFRHYWKRVDEVYPSKYGAFQILSKGRGLKFKMKLSIYSLWIWFIK